MTGGEPPLPPSRNPYPPWQGRPYRRRGGGPATARNGWVGRRPRSPPPPARPRHPRGAPYRHHRHLSQQHPSPQSNSHQSTYQHHGPPPLSRNLQGRLRSPPRSPPPRRSELGLHRDEPLRGEPHRGERDRLDQHRGEQHRGEPLRGEAPRGESHRGEPLRGEPHRGEAHRGEALRGEALRGEQHRGEHHRSEHRGEQHRGDQHPGDPHRGDQHRGEHPYRGEPGPAHRIDPPDRGLYRGVEPYAPPRGLQPNPRGEPGAFRSEQRSHRGSGDHHVPYRGEPGPLYRADLSSHREDMDSRRGATESALSRGDSNLSYSPWFRHPSKIHKPVKRKMRRQAPHISGLSRPLQLSKPESPILSRMSFPHAERGSGSSRTDALPSSNWSSSKPSSSFPNASSKWHTEPSPRFNASPRPYERDLGRRFDRGSRPPPLSGNSIMKKKAAAGSTEQSRSPLGDSFPRKSGSFMGRGSFLRKSPTSDERAKLPQKSSPESLSNRKEEDFDGKRHGEESGYSVKIPTLSPRGPEKVSSNAMNALNSIGSKDRRGSHDLVRAPLKNAVSDFSMASEGAGLRGAYTPSSKDVLVTIVKEESSRAAIVTSNHRRPWAEKKAPAVPSSTARNDSMTHVPLQSPDKKSDHVLVQTQEKSLSRLSVQPDISTKAPVSSQGVLLAQEAPVGSSSQASLAAASSKDVQTPKDDSQRELRSSLPHSGAVKTVQETLSKVSGTVEMKIGSLSSPSSPLSPPKPLASPPAPAETSAVLMALPLKGEKPLGLEAPGSSRSIIKVKESVPANAGSQVRLPSPASDSAPVMKSKKAEERNKPLSTVLPGQTSPASHVNPRAPVLPSLNLRSVLSSSTPVGSVSLAKPTTPITSTAMLHSLLRPTTPVAAKTEDTKACVSPKLKPPSSQEQEAIQSAPRASSVARSPVSVPAPAISFLRSSPKCRVRGTAAGVTLNSLNSIGLNQSPEQTKQSPEKTEAGNAATVRDALVQQIHETEKQISALERKIAQQRALKASTPQDKEAKKEMQALASILDDELLQKVALIARKIAAEADERSQCMPRVSLEPMHGALRLIVVHDQAKAAAATAALRPRCHDPEVGLYRNADAALGSFPPLSEELLERVASEVAKKRSAAFEKKKSLGREYHAMRESWLRTLKSARDKKSKEKREAIKERDRFLVLRTKGHSALLTSRTSSGRMSTKIFPFLNSNGQMNGNADVDALLAEIAAEGGTPGAKEIWSKTLADVPDQDASWMPCDNTSVLVEDPVADFNASRWVNPWRFEEKLIFLEKFVVYSKNFRKIASFLEHKSTRECSQFYYANKLDLGLKQLAKESSTLKRKGVLKPHIVTLAKKRLSFESADAISAHTETFLSSHNLVNGSSCEKGGLNSEAPIDLEGNGGGHVNDKMQAQRMKMMLKKRIIAESVPQDMSDIDFDKFSRVIAACGTDWREVASAMAVPGRSSTYYREIYRRNRRRLRADDGVKLAATRMTPLSRCPTPPLRYSPRVTPRTSPNPSPSPRQRRLSRGIDTKELEPLILDDGAEVELVALSSRKHRNSASPSARSPMPQPRSAAGLEYKPSTESGRRGAGANEPRKNRTTTWTPEEGEKFKQLFKRYNRNWKKIAQIMSPKTPTQVKGYWRKVAHEVGNGHPVDSLKSWKSDKKRPRRSSSMDEIVRGEVGEEKRLSPDKKSSSSGQSGTPRSETMNHDAKRARSEREEAKRARSEREEGARGDEGDRDLARASQEGSVRNAVVASSRAKEGSNVSLNGDLASGSAGRDQERGRNVSDEDGPLRQADSPVLSSSRLPSLRSAPLPMRPAPLPMFRSVPVARKVPEPSSAGADRTSSASLSRDLAVDDGKNRKTEDGPRHVELRKAAESYGVLELLGSRLEDASNAQRDKK